MNIAAVSVLAGLVVWAGSVQAQNMESALANAPDGRVRLSFAARPDVCGENGRRWGGRSDDHWDSSDSCVNGPIHVQLRKRDGAIVGARTYVGGRWRGSAADVFDLGMVSAPVAAKYLLGLVSTHPVAHRVIHAAALADSVEIWPELIELASDASLPQRTIKEAMQWLGITAGRLFDDDDALDEESDARRHALFSVTQLPDDESIPRLIDVSESHRFEYMRALALFWLGQSGDQRALPVLERVFRMRG